MNYTLDLPHLFLENEHVVNFHAENPTLPEWLHASLTLKIGAGDLERNSVLDIERFRDFDVFYCLPWNDHGSFVRNVEYIQTNYYHKKIICYIDNTNAEQLEKFVTLFQNRFSYISRFQGHCPQLPIEVYVKKILRIGGKIEHYAEPNDLYIHANDLMNKFLFSTDMTLEGTNSNAIMKNTIRKMMDMPVDILLLSHIHGDTTNLSIVFRKYLLKHTGRPNQTIHRNIFDTLDNLDISTLKHLVYYVHISEELPPEFHLEIGEDTKAYLLRVANPHGGRRKRTRVRQKTNIRNRRSKARAIF